MKNINNLYKYNKFDIWLSNKNLKLYNLYSKVKYSLSEWWYWKVKKYRINILVIDNKANKVSFRYVCAIDKDNILTTYRSDACLHFLTFYGARKTIKQIKKCTKLDNKQTCKLFILNICVTVI